MAEYMTVIRESYRLCQEQDDCKLCPIVGNLCVRSMMQPSEAECEAFERKVMEWSEKNKRPTWTEYLVEIGVIPQNSKSRDVVAREMRTTMVPEELLEALKKYGEKAEKSATDDRWVVYDAGRGAYIQRVVHEGGKRFAYWTQDRKKAKTWVSYSGAVKAARHWPQSRALGPRSEPKGGDTDA